MSAAALAPRAPAAPRPPSTAAPPYSASGSASASTHAARPAPRRTAPSAAPGATYPPPGAAPKAITSEAGPGASVDDDAALYAAVAAELPDCPVLDSILHTHRGRLEHEETTEELLGRVGSSVTDWRARAEAEGAARQRQMRDDAAAEEAREAALTAVEDAKRDARLRELEMRLQSLQAAVDQDMARMVGRRQGSAVGSKSAAPDGGPPAASPFRKEWELLQIANSERDREADKQRRAIVAAERANRTRESGIALASESAKIGIAEQLTRCSLYSEQEAHRVLLKRAQVLAGERIGMLDDSRGYLRRAVVAVEAGERAGLAGAAGADRARVRALEEAAAERRAAEEAARVDREDEAVTIARAYHQHLIDQEGAAVPAEEREEYEEGAPEGALEPDSAYEEAEEGEE